MQFKLFFQFQDCYEFNIEHNHRDEQFLIHIINERKKGTRNWQNYGFLYYAKNEEF